MDSLVGYYLIKRRGRIRKNNKKESERAKGRSKRGDRGSDYNLEDVAEHAEDRYGMKSKKDDVTYIPFIPPLVRL